MPPAETAALADRLAKHIAGDVRFDDGARALYATDSSNYRQVPIGVVVPRSIDDVIATVAACRDFDVPLLPRGGGTSLAGQCCNAAVVVDFSKHINRVLDIDPEKRTAWVEPGCVLDWLRGRAELHHLTFGPDPSTHSRNTLGGMIGNDSCGVHSVMAGRTADNVEELEILTYDGQRMTVGRTPPAELQRFITAGGRRGQIYRDLTALRDRTADLVRQRYPRIPRRVSGYCLDQLLPENDFNVARALVGSEGTCATILKAKVNLVHSPPGRAVVVLGFKDVYAAGDAVPHILEYKPIGLEGMDEVLVQLMRKRHLHTDAIGLLPEGDGWLLVEFGGESVAEASDKAKAMVDHLKREGHAPSARIYDKAQDQQRIWQVREAGLGATANVPGERPSWEGWEDAAVRPDKVGSYLREFRRLLNKFNYSTTLYGHFGDGCIHCRINFDLETERGIHTYRRFVDEAADLVIKHGGSLSGEHGDGQSRGPLLVKMYGSELVNAFADFKRIWDPTWKMNPGKKVDPAPVTAHLRLGAGYKLPHPKTVFKFPEDQGSFGHAALRCVGVGECRRSGGGVMCPSYMVTREERYSTRGRAHLLWEMLNGGPDAKDGWRSDAVRDALDLCLACKGCKRDCPVNVDMATYKAEFMSHYYRGRLRPRAAYSMGLIKWWAQAASSAPKLANALMQNSVTGRLVKTLGGIAQQRRFPPFAPVTFRAGARQRKRATGGRRVVLFADTFNNYFTPNVAHAAVSVLDDLGYEVESPQVVVCCARPLYAAGMLDLARQQVLRAIETLAPLISDGAKMVVLEPACLASFRDEFRSLFPDDARAQALAKQSVSLDELLAELDCKLPQTQQSALVHLHCHEHAIVGTKSKTKVLDRTGLDYRILNAGCCGMAGSFGFEAEHYDISVRAAERVLMPELRLAASDTLIVADGFSCREQVSQLLGRRPLHLAEVLQRSRKARP